MRKLDAILVTGGCGFIGSAFIRLLFRTPEWRGSVVNLDCLTYAGNPENLDGHVDASRYTFVHGSITDSELVAKVCREHPITAIVNFAAESHVDRSIHGPREFVETNVLGTFTLLEAVRANPEIHFHHVSTDEVYGSLGDTGLFHETTAYNPKSPYSASKAASDHFVRAYANTYGISVTVSNCSNNYGPYQFPEKLIPLVTLNCLEGKSLPVYGEGKNVRDWLFVDDHVEAIWLILQRGASRATYNIGGDCERQNIDIVHSIIRTVADLAGKSEETLKSSIEFVSDRPGHDWRYAIDHSKITETLGWTPARDFEVGLRETVQWILDNPAWVESVRSGAYRDWLNTNYSGR